MLSLARSMEDEHYWVVEEIDGMLVETLWGVEREVDGWRLSHAVRIRSSVRSWCNLVPRRRRAPPRSVK